MHTLQEGSDVIEVRNGLIFRFNIVQAHKSAKKFFLMMMMMITWLTRIERIEGL